MSSETPGNRVVPGKGLNPATATYEHCRDAFNCLTGGAIIVHPNQTITVTLGGTPKQMRLSPDYLPRIIHMLSIDRPTWADFAKCANILATEMDQKIPIMNEDRAVKWIELPTRLQTLARIQEERIREVENKAPRR